MLKLYKALLAAQNDMPSLTKDATNPAFRSSYATLAQVQDTAFPVLRRHGLIVTQTARTEIRESGGLIVTVGVALIHAESGELINFDLSIPPAKADPQGVGSAITYGRRFALMTLLGLAPDDDDGNGASGVGGQQNRAPQGKPQPKPSNWSAPDKPPAKPARPEWKGTPEAIVWAVETGAYPDEAEARAALKRALQSVYPGRDSCKPHELPAVLDAFHADAKRQLA